MKHYTNQDIALLDKLFRIHLINGITGIKPANLVGTISDKGKTNLAIFSSVVHLGSNPALIGFFVRPTDKVPRHTYENIIANKSYTINHVQKDMIKEAHFTSAKFPKEVSEFEKCGFEAEYLNDHLAPYVGQGQIKIGLTLKEVIDIKSNNTKLIVGAVDHIYLAENLLDERGQINLEQANSVGISGVSTYYDLNIIDMLPYARVSDWNKNN